MFILIIIHESIESNMLSSSSITFRIGSRTAFWVCACKACV